MIRSAIVTVHPHYLAGDYADRNSLPRKFNIAPKIHTVAVDGCISSDANSCFLKIALTGWGMLRIRPKTRRDWFFCGARWYSGLYLPADTELIVIVPKDEVLEVCYWNLFGRHRTVFKTPPPDEALPFFDPSSIDNVSRIGTIRLEFPKLTAAAFAKPSVSGGVFRAVTKIGLHGSVGENDALRPIVTQKTLLPVINRKAFSFVRIDGQSFRPHGFAEKIRSSLRAYFSATKFD